MLKELLDRIENSRFAPLLQFVKFGLVGVSNTLISYGTEMLCYYILFANSKWDEQIKIIVISVLAFVISVTNSYYWNNKYVFKTGNKKSLWEHAVTYGKTVMCYSLTGLVFAPLMKMYLSGIGVPYWFASLVTLIVTIPVNFVLNKFWAFAKGK